MFESKKTGDCHEEMNVALFWGLLERIFGKLFEDLWENFGWSQKQSSSGNDINSASVYNIELID